MPSAPAPAGLHAVRHCAGDAPMPDIHLLDTEEDLAPDLVNSSAGEIPCRKSLALALLFCQMRNVTGAASA